MDEASIRRWDTDSALADGFGTKGDAAMFAGTEGWSLAMPMQTDLESGWPRFPVGSGLRFPPPGTSSIAAGRKSGDSLI